MVYNGIFQYNFPSISALTKIRKHQLKVLLIKARQKPEGAYNTDLHEFKTLVFPIELPDELGKDKNHIFQINLLTYLVQK